MSEPSEQKETLLRILRSPALNDWEKQFVRDRIEGIEKWGPLSLSEKQTEVLSAISAKAESSGSTYMKNGRCALCNNNYSILVPELNYAERCLCQGGREALLNCLDRVGDFALAASLRRTPVFDWKKYISDLNNTERGDEICPILGVKQIT